MPYDEDPRMSHEDDSGKNREIQQIAQEGDPEDNDREDKYSFLQETIKTKPISREKLIRQLIRIAVCGVLLGGFACLGFFALKPWAQSWFRGDPQTVTIPEDEQPSEEEDASAAAEAPAEQVLDAESYEEIMDSMNAVAQEARKGTASVSVVSAEQDWNTEATGIRPSVTGVITADNGQELLILADDSLCGEGDAWNVTFSDGTVHSASLKQRDATRGLAVFSVARTGIASSTWNAVKVSVLGNSNLVKQGQAVIALGSMFGYADGAAYGIISSNDYQEKFYDGECSVLSTDIAAGSDGTGVLFNLDGEVIGLISSKIWDDEDESTANAYAISDLKTTIELLANGDSVPYIGIYGTAVSRATQREQGIPEGIYVIEVDPDSPAMAAGIQNGDVIWEVGGEDVSSAAAYQRALFDTMTGDTVTLRGKRLGTDGYVDVEFTVTVGSKEG